MTIQSNITAYQEAEKAVLAHCMCAKVEPYGNKLTIIYPYGDWPVDGIRVDRSAHGLKQALAYMERHWQESFPGRK